MSKPLHNRPVNSGHLTRLEIHGITVYERFLDFSNCPSLEHLEFDNCFFNFDTRFHISAPSLVSLVFFMTFRVCFPIKLESMPSLVKAVVKIIEDTLDSCFYYNYCHCEFCDNSHSIGDGTGSNNSVLLKGLSEAKDLALTSETKTVRLPFHLYLNYIMSFHYWWGGGFFFFLHSLSPTVQNQIMLASSFSLALCPVYFQGRSAIYPNVQFSCYISL